MFRIVVLPDLQAYSDRRIKLTQDLFGIGDQGDVLHQQVAWLAENAKSLNVSVVLQEGDLTQTNFDEEWELTESAIAQLDPVVPYLLAVGNHDQGYTKNPKPGKFWVSNERDCKINEYFPPRRFQENPLYDYGGNLNDSTENYFLRFEADGLKFLMLSLEFMPRNEALEWANQVTADHPDHRVLVVTHGFLNSSAHRDLRGDHYEMEGNSAQQIWDRFLRRHPNIFMVCCGHNYGEARRTDIGDHGNEVHQIMANYQWWENGGNGWLRMMTFYPEENRIHCETYSPVLDKWRRADSSDFSIEYPMTTSAGVYPHLTLLQLKKLRQYFSVLDADGNGFLEVEDFLMFRDRLANIRGLDPDHERYTLMTDTLMALWENYRTFDTDGDSRLTQREFMTHWSDAMGDPSGGWTNQHINDFVDMAFAIIDANGDGEVGLVEFLLFLKALGIHHGQVGIFKSLDTNGDGQMDRNELRAHAREFFLGDNPESPANHLFGHLPHQ